jgi:hypothetical protein
MSRLPPIEPHLQRYPNSVDIQQVQPHKHERQYPFSFLFYLSLSLHQFYFHISHYRARLVRLLLEVRKISKVANRRCDGGFRFPRVHRSKRSKGLVGDSGRGFALRGKGELKDPNLRPTESNVRVSELFRDSGADGKRKNRLSP